MGTHMKTTVEIADPLLRRAKALARARKTTLRLVLEDALRKHLEDSADAQARPFVLADASVGGRGLRPEFRDAPFSAALDAIYEGRGA